MTCFLPETVTFGGRKGAIRNAAWRNPIKVFQPYGCGPEAGNCFTDTALSIPIWPPFLSLLSLSCLTCHRVWPLHWDNRVRDHPGIHAWKRTVPNWTISTRNHTTKNIGSICRPSVIVLLHSVVYGFTGMDRRTRTFHEMSGRNEYEYKNRPYPKWKISSAIYWQR